MDRRSRSSHLSGCRRCTGQRCGSISMTTTTLSTLGLPVGMAAAAGIVGCFAIMRRMALASDAMAHVALPGIAIALALRLNPVLGGLAALVVGTLLVWAVEH